MAFLSSALNLRPLAYSGSDKGILYQRTYIVN